MKNLSFYYKDPVEKKAAEALIYQSIGRYLCWHFYRDSASLKRCFGAEAIDKIFTPAIEKSAIWGQLLMGGFRKEFTGYARRPKYEFKHTTDHFKRHSLGCQLEEGPWAGKPAIDGFGTVREREVALYQFVGELAVEHISDIKDAGIN